MPFIPVPDTAELVATYTLPNGNQAKNVINFRETLPGGWDTLQLTALANAYAAWETATARALRSNTVSLTNILCRELNIPDGLVVELPQAIPGTLASPTLPSNCTLSVKHTTGRAGRSYRGRTYFIGLSESQVTGDYVTVPAGNAIVAAYNNLRTTLQPAGFFMVVVSRYNAGVPRVVGEATDVLNSQAVDFRIDTQRRRLPGEGT